MDLCRVLVLMCTCLQGGWLALADLSEELRSDREVVLAAVRYEGWALEVAAAELRGDKEVAAPHP